jgi:cell division protein FtsZ
MGNRKGENMGVQLIGRRHFLRMSLLSIPLACYFPRSFLDLLEKELHDLGRKWELGESLFSDVKVIGIGRAGIRITNSIANGAFTHADLIAIDCDPQELDISIIQTKIRIEVPKRGLDLSPTMLSEAVTKDDNILKNSIDAGEAALVITGLGGITGTELAPIVSRIAKEQGAFTTAVATTPFRFEGTMRARRADIGLSRLVSSSDFVFLLENQFLLSRLGNDLSVKEAFQHSDRIVANFVNSFLRSILGEPKMQ